MLIATELSELLIPPLALIMLVNIVAKPLYGPIFISCYFQAKFVWHITSIFLCFFFFLQEGGTKETHFHIAINSILQSLKAQIIGRSYDEVAICFYNTVS